MREIINEKVDVITVFKKGRGIVEPLKLRWAGRDYAITKIGLHHPVRDGRTLFHIYSCTDGTTFFRLKLNTESMQWLLEEVNDGLPT